MRTLIIAALALSPMMLNAQANSPAATQTSSLVRPNDLRAAAAVNSAVPTATPLRISTGVVSPKLVSTVSIVENQQHLNAVNLDRLAIVSMIVDASGKPKDLKIVRSAGSLLDANVLDAVSQYRFTPGTLNNEPTAIPVTLEITLHHSGM